MKWHEALIANYKNPLAQQLLSDLKVKIFFFEKVFMDEKHYHTYSETHHDSIINALQKNNKTVAISLLKQNWMQILNYIKNE